MINLEQVHFPIWRGVHINTQADADARIPQLLADSDNYRTSSNKYFLEIIPVERIDLSKYLFQAFCQICSRHYYDVENCEDCPHCKHPSSGIIARHPRTPIDWVRVSGFQGVGALPIHPDWVRSIRDQCAELYCVAFWFDGWGDWLPWQGEHHNDEHTALSSDVVGELKPFHPVYGFNVHEDLIHEYCKFANVGATISGRILDGEVHMEIPR